MKNVHIQIEGKVQHKGFRFTAMQMAYQCGIRGIVRNQKGGSLYIEAEGDDENLEKFISWCRKGPVWAKVEKIIVEDGEFKNYQSFDIL